MLCIELSRNGKRLATAGLPGKGVLSAIFDRVLTIANGPKELRRFSLGGLDLSTQPNLSVGWAYGKIEHGDEFVLRFLDLPEADPPRHRSHPRPRSKATERRARMEHLRRIEAEAKELREHLGLRPNKSRGPRGRGKSS